MSSFSIIGLICQIFLYSLFAAAIVIILSLLRKLFLQKSSWSTKKIPNNGRAFFSSQLEPLNLVVLTGILFFEIVMITIKVGFKFEGKVGDIPGLYLTFVPLGIILYLGIENIIKNLLGINKQKSLEKLAPLETPSLETKIKVDLKRKSWHVIGFLIVFAILWLGYFVIKSRFDNDPYNSSNEVLFENYWGNVNPEEFIRVMFIRESLPMGQTLTVFIFYTGTIIFVILDLTRLSGNIHFFLQKNAQKHIHFKEMKTIAAYTHFMVAYFAASIFLPPMLFMGTLCLGVFADPAASIVGMNWGKHKIKWTDKTVEGTIAGSILAFITMIWFVGPIYALFGTLVFIIIDLITPKPVKLSDNLVIPLAITIVFIILSLMGITSYNLFI